MNGGTAPNHLAEGDIDDLVVQLVGTISGRTQRYLLGVTGPPGAGKSTLANRVVTVARQHGVPSCVAPMDGFHRSNEELAEIGLLALKGVPATFDGAGFVSRLRAVRSATGNVVWPTFDRSLEEVVPDGSVIDGSTRLVVVEGNYLLLDDEPWAEVRGLLDAVWYLHVPEHVLIERLRARHELARAPDDAWAKVQSTDLPNAALVAATRHRADVIIDGG